jgi:hypothetical protein
MDDHWELLMSRKKFILTGIFLCFAGACLWAGWWLRIKSKKDMRGIIVEILRRRLDYVHHAPWSLSLFASEYQGQLDGYGGGQLLKCALFLPIYGLFDLWIMRSATHRGAYLDVTQPLVTRYLLATGFFSGGKGEPNYSSPLDYKAGALRGSRVCNNPWADFSGA